LQAQEEGKQRLGKLIARVPSLLVTVRRGPSLDDDRLVVTLDGSPISFKAGAVRLNPGAHTLKLSAPGYRPFEHPVTLPEKGGVVVVDVVLEQEGASAPTASTAPTASPAASSQQAGSSKVPAVIAFTIGGAGVAVGAVTGVMSLGKVSELRDHCPSNVCAPSEQSTLDNGKMLATVSTIGFIAGGVGIGAGVTLLLLGHPKHAETSASVDVSPWIGWGAAGVTGRF
jgi:hypothetical protein